MLKSGQLLRSIPSNSLIVMDNASYHSHCKEEYKSRTKTKMMQWLDRKGIPYSNQCKKLQIWDIIKRHQPAHPEYHVEAVAK